MRSDRIDDRPGCGSDGGFTLIEVIVSLVLLGIVATAALYFFIQGTKTTTHLQRSQNAVAVANEAMERAYAINPQNNVSSGVAGLVVGRAQADVEAAWSTLAGLGVEGVDDTYPLWDPAVATSASAVLKITTQADHSGQTYDITTLVGTCFRSSSVVATDQVCGKLSGVTDDPGDAGTPANMVRMLRITTVVTWPATAGQCPGGVCSYQLSGLVDRSSDLKWNQVINPIAVDDFEAFEFGETRAIDVLANDLLGPVTSNPVTIVVGPAVGQGTATVTSSGMVTYTAPANASGRFTFTYRIKDASGHQSSPATIEITILPKAFADTARVLSGTSTTLAVTANDKGSPATVTIKNPPSNGTATVSGIGVVYTPTATSGGDAFTYTFTDGAGQETAEVPVNVLIDYIYIQDRIIEIPGRASGPDVWTELKTALMQGNADTTGFTITATGPKPAAGTLKVGAVTYNGANLLGTSVTYSPALNTPGDFVFSYYLTNGSGLSTAAKSVTLRVLPVVGVAPIAQPDTISGTVNENGDRNIRVGSNDTPTVFTGAVGNGVTVELGTVSPTCGYFLTNQTRYANGEIRINVPNISNNSTRACSFTYTLVNVANPALRSATVTVTYTIEDD